MAKLDEIKPEDATARALFEGLLEELGGEEAQEASDEAFIALTELLGQLAVAQSIEQLSSNIERLVDTYQMNSL